jgi:enamine deaminase RidA (YjgF/YER057c/UK114 family)
MAQQIDARLAELGIELPKANPPVANYVPFVVSGNLAFLSGQLPQWNGERPYIGRVGTEVSVEDGVRAARLCGLNLLAWMQRAAGGDLDRIARIVKLGGFVNCAPEFSEQPKIVNGCSDLLVSIFGDAGRHARTAVGVNALPFNVAVEIDAIVELKA